ncbi:MAG: cation:proton antiporter [Gaiellaceae bacterium]
MAGRLVVAYVVLFAVGGALAATSFLLGEGRSAQPKVAGIFGTYAPCLGGAGQFRLEQSGQFVDASGLDAAKSFGGALRLRHQRLTGTVRCADGSRARLDLAWAGGGARPELQGTIGDARVTALFVRDLPRLGVVAAPAPGNQPSAEHVFGRLMLAIAAVLLAARLIRAGMSRLGQPPVMGEVLAGILLGPTLLGALAPSVQEYLFPSFVIPLLAGAAAIGLAFYMFLVGLELDPRQLRGRIGHAAAISNASIVLPLGLGIAVALPLFGLLAPPDTSFQAFALFMGVAMSITAFPVLARILIERRMLARPVGALALSAAAVDDVTAWGLLAIASGIAGHGSALGALPVLGYVLAFCAGMALLARPLLHRVSAAYDEAGQVPSGWISAIFVGVLLSAYVSMESGVAPIFGAFVMGLIMPRRADLSHDVTRRLEDFVGTLLLPLFFVVTGLRTDVGLLDRPELWALTLLIVAVAIAGKWLGAMAIARVAGYTLRDSAVLGALMNTRGLTELIVLNIGLELGVISPALFTMLVLMALVTTFMAAPAIRLLDPRGELSAPVEDELREADRERPELADAAERSILVAPLEERNVDELLVLAEPLARSVPPRELIVTRLLSPPRVGATLAAREREISRAGEALARVRATLGALGIPARSVAFTSADRGRDLVRLAAEQEVDLLLVDGRRPLLGAGVPRGEVGAVLADAPCDVAVLIEREHVPTIDAEHPVVVAFGGEEHDQGALELAAAIAAGTGAPLRLLGSSDQERLLADASLSLQRRAGVAADPILTPPGAAVEATAGAGLLVVGLPALWRQEGLAPLSAALAKSAAVPTLLVRTGRGH